MSISIVAAVATLADLATAGVAIYGNIQKVSALISKAQAEGRDELTDAEWAEATELDDAARDRLAEAIAKKESGA